MTTDKQILLERLMSDMGRDRYWYKVNANARFNHATRSPATRYLLREAVAKTTKAVKSWRASVLAGEGRMGARWHDLVADITPGVIALLAVRNVLDISARPMGAAAAAHAIGSAVEEEVNFMAMRDTAPHVWADLKKRLKSTGDRRRRSKLVKKAAASMVLRLVKWDRAQCIGLGTTLIELVVLATSLVELQKVYGRNRHCKVLVVPTLDTLQWIERAHEEHEVLFPFYLPTIEPPVAWENPYDGGYHTNILFRSPLVKTRSRATLALLSANSGKMREVYSAINSIQDTAWEINPVVFEVAQHFWKSGIALAGIPERVDDPLPIKPGEGATDEELTAWRHEYRARRLRVLQARSNRVLAGKCMFMAEKFKDIGVFYYPHMLDFRGRAYPTPFFLQPQGSSLARGLLRFAVGGPLRTPEQQQWFLIHGANCFGVDKVSFEARVEWVYTHAAQILAVHRDPVDCRWWTDASKPWEFLAWCLEFAEWQEDPAYESKIPVAMDGSNNGLQLYSLLMRDPVGAEATNCSPSDGPRDIYQAVADDVTAQLLADSNPMAAQWISFCSALRLVLPLLHPLHARLVRGRDQEAWQHTLRARLRLLELPRQIHLEGYWQERRACAGLYGLAAGHRQDRHQARVGRSLDGTDRLPCSAGVQQVPQRIHHNQHRGEGTAGALPEGYRRGGSRSACVWCGPELRPQPGCCPHGSLSEP
jgi:DNA-directed RNA polymerase